MTDLPAISAAFGLGACYGLLVKEKRMGIARRGIQRAAETAVEDYPVPTSRNEYRPSVSLSVAVRRRANG